MLWTNTLQDASSVRTKKNNTMKKHNIDKMPIPALLLIGIGIGLLTGQVAAFTLIGLGLGIFLTYFLSKKTK